VLVGKIIGSRDGRMLKKKIRDILVNAKKAMEGK
jgi:hypothetical protein